ncbi:NAD(P)/FAD-dependent oxidoreductase [Streptomyces sp. NPDC059443]|uniref:NAD(P)/FAD-dependent oxidoreductase n=1 Tax=unclassified Streptomyces TaxID=2593676 RepID=UPI0036839A05
MTKAVVLGGGFAGVLAATVLARHAYEVTVVEGGRYPAGPAPRPGLPQAFHSHVLVTAGAEALETLLPGTRAALAARGAHRRGLSDGALILSAGGWFRRHETGAFLISCSRWLMDHVIRERALAGGAVSVRERTRVLGLAGDASRVTGVRVAREDGSTETLRADLVVDATGRRSRAPRWLAALGAPPVEEEVVDPGLAYSTRIYRAPAALASHIPAIMLHPDPHPRSGRPGHGATLFPVEDGRWTVTLTGTRAAAPPADGQGFTDCVRALRSPVLAELLAEAEPLGAVRPFRATANRRRYFERRPGPEGFLVLGDALVAVNPVHSHGMSVALLSAVRIDRELARGGAGPGALPALQAAVAEVADTSWRMVIEQDRGPACGEGAAAAAGHRVRALMSRAVLGNPALLTDLFRTQTLLPPRTRTAADPPPHPVPSAAARPPRDTDEAVAQFPVLAEWWFSGRRTLPEPALEESRGH